MGFQRLARHSGVILLTLALIAIFVAINYPRTHSGQDTLSGVRVAVPPQPTWKELSSEQKTILAPLEVDWDNMERFRRKKWLEIAARFPSLSNAEQERLRDRMQDWANLTPEQRQAARERFKELSKRTNAEEREALAQKWTDYQNLPKEVRERLEKSARDQEKANKRAARTPALEGKPTPITTQEGALPSGTAAASLATAPGAVKVVPPNPAAPVSPLTFAPTKPSDESTPTSDITANESR